MIPATWGNKKIKKPHRSRVGVMGEAEWVQLSKGNLGTKSKQEENKRGNESERAPGWEGEEEPSLG